MRNWNSISQLFQFLLLYSFYSTYEELKRPPQRFQIAKALCFYSTYEELKHPLAKGLLHFCSHVFTVPMRNWNLFGVVTSVSPLKSFYSTYEELKPSKSSSSKYLPFSFLQYLWGIETWQILSLQSKATSFLQYLWGIETAVNMTEDSIYNWFLQYLWGIETWVSQFFQQD